VKKDGAFGILAVVAALAFIVGRSNRHFLTCEDFVAATRQAADRWYPRGPFGRPHRAREGPMPMTHLRPELTEEAAAHYGRMLVRHADDPDTGQCRVCFEPCCPQWSTAFLMLLASLPPSEPAP
jgi:hypothetical protein